MNRIHSLIAIGLAIFLLPCSGCWSAAEQEVVVYSALDSEFAEPILQQFERDERITVRAKFDVEANKTVGLTQALIAESSRPRCDVYWNNEILHTLRLEKLGLLDVYPSPAGEKFPSEFRGKNRSWHGFAARARVLLVNTNLVPSPEDRPGSIRELTNVRWKEKCGLAKPLFGTTATHAACLFAVWGDEKGQDFFRNVKANGAKIFPGNKQVARAVSAGEIAWGLTDTDDATEEIAAGRPVMMVYPDQGADELGTLFIPNTLAIIKGGPHQENARKLVEYLLAPAIEEQLANGPSAQIPLNPLAKTPPSMQTPHTIRPMRVDFGAAADCWETTAQFLRTEF